MRPIVGWASAVILGLLAAIPRPGHAQTQMLAVTTCGALPTGYTLFPAQFYNWSTMNLNGQPCNANGGGGGGGGGTSSNYGAAFPNAGTAAGFYNGGNMDYALTDSTHHLYVDLFNSSIAVTGTFFQATQPVSGTFWQATQPVSVAAAVTVVQPTASALNETEANSAAILSAVQAAIPAGTNVIGKIAVTPTTPAAGTAHVVTTGGTAVTMVTGPVNGCYITNPLSATDEGIATAEVAYVNGVTTATTTGNGTNNTIQPGQAWSCVPGQTTNVSVNAATSSHALTVVAW